MASAMTSARAGAPKPPSASAPSNCRIASIEVSVSAESFSWSNQIPGRRPRFFQSALAPLFATRSVSLARQHLLGIPKRSAATVSTGGLRKRLSIELLFKRLGEIPAIVEKPLMGLRLPASIIVLGNAQNRAYVVRHFEKPAGIRIGVPIVRDVLSEHKIQRIMQRRADSALPIVVIHGDGIEGLEIRQAIEDGQSEVPPQPRFELVSVMDGRAVVPQREKRDRKLSNKAGNWVSRRFLSPGETLAYPSLP